MREPVVSYSQRTIVRFSAKIVVQCFENTCTFHAKSIISQYFNVCCGIAAKSLFEKQKTVDAFRNPRV